MLNGGREGMWVCAVAGEKLGAAGRPWTLQYPEEYVKFR